MSGISSIAPKLQKLIPMLSSENDGERVATVRAIDRTLKGAKLDWHDLAKALATGGSSGGPRAQSWSYEDMARRQYDQAQSYREKYQREEEERQRQRARREQEAREAAENIRRETEARRAKKNDKVEAVEWCLKQRDRLSAREEEFLSSVRNQLLKGWELSDKQKKWLIDIYDRLQRGR